MELRHLPLLLLLPHTLAFENDFSFYPQNAQTCLETAASESKCTGTSAQENNECLCTNGGDFVINTAKCLGANDPGDVQSVYSLMLTACNESDTPLTVSKSQFEDAAKQGGETATTSAGPSSTATSTPTQTGEKEDDGGLSTGAMAGIGVGAAVIGASAIIGTAFFCLRLRRRRNSEEAHPMLPSHGPGSFQPMDPSPELGQYGAETKPAWSGTGPYWDAGAGAGAGNEGVVKVAAPAVASGYVAPGRVFEIDGAERAGAVEMPGSMPLSYQSGWPR